MKNKLVLIFLFVFMFLLMPINTNARTSTTVVPGKTCTIHDNYYMFHLEVGTSSYEGREIDSEGNFTIARETYKGHFYDNIPSTAEKESGGLVSSFERKGFNDKLFEILDSGKSYRKYNDGTYFIHVKYANDTIESLDYPFFYENEDVGYWYPDDIDDDIKERFKELVLNAYYPGGANIESNVYGYIDVPNFGLPSDLGDDYFRIDITRELNLNTNVIEKNGINMSKYWPNSEEIEGYYSLVVPALYRYSYYDPSSDCVESTPGSTPETDEKKQSYTITYSANGGTNAPAQQIKNEDVTAYISKQEPTREGYTFLGWSKDVKAKESDSKYAPGAAYTENQNLILYAVWTPKSGLGYSIGIITAIIVLTGVGVWYFGKRNKFENV